MALSQRAALPRLGRVSERIALTKGFPTHSIALRTHKGSKGHICRSVSSESALICIAGVVGGGMQKRKENIKYGDIICMIESIANNKLPITSTLQSSMTIKRETF